MHQALYLDTARLGLMSPSAQLLHTAFARLAGDPNGLLYFSEFLSSGFQAWPERMRRRFPQLAAWAGLADLKSQLRDLVGAAATDDISLASRSRSLLPQALQKMTLRCRRVLTVDLLWPPYRKLLQQACRTTQRDLIIVRLMDSALRRGRSTEELASIICENYVSQKCDGLMLPVIDHRGVWLPIAKLVETLRRYRPVRFVVADASQALGHLPLDGLTSWCDVLLAGCHKWLGGYHPLGIAVTRDDAGSSVRPQAIKEPPSSRVADDPLRQFVLELEGGTSIRHGETAPVIPLLSACGAITDAMNQGIEKSLAARQANRCWLYYSLQEIGWRPTRPALGPTSGILLARAPTGSEESGKHLPTREVFASHGVVLTVYRQGLVRFSLPCRPIPGHHRVQVLKACQAIGGCIAAKTARTSHHEEVFGLPLFCSPNTHFN